MGEAEETKSTRSGIRRMVLGLLILVVVGGLVVAGVVVRRELFDVDLTEVLPPVDVPAPSEPAAPKQVSDPQAPLEESALRGRIDYVALGDSYAAGPGLATQRDDPASCARSTANYPAVLAASLGVATYRDASCTGARTADVLGRQIRPTGGPVRPQASALGRGTDLVTLTLGANDDGVSGDLLGGRCPELASQDPSGSPCRDSYLSDGRDELMTRVLLLRPRLVDVVRTIRATAPRAAVVLVGYLDLFPPDDGCAEVPFAAGDLTWGASLVAAIDATLLSVARSEGVRFVDVRAAGAGHDACSADPWVNGATSVVGAGWAYHPTRDGMEGVARAVLAQLTGAPPGS
ncbi:MAG: SGNH/GDSL hydrolase family protein [Actinobacteria bacterium]|uniref:Unannotated protein n=1 Tax=freshwater metagenome TaxID=449393 RepID=A0A6J6NZK2_9ZZZZ|nr:SGNH/GDSL hydrolase family protein [Actinomycetota bacterium]